MNSVLIIFAIAITLVAATTCPNGASCSGTETCCQTSSGYGCCPFAQATCCSDDVHCCPHGYTCDLSKGECAKNGSAAVEKMFAKVAATKKNPLIKSRIVGTTCANGQQCSSSQTCCQTSSGYGCCPYADATCCSDDVHCCPNGYKCDLTKGQCVQASSVGMKKLSRSQVFASPVQNNKKK